MVDIDIQNEISKEDEALVSLEEIEGEAEPNELEEKPSKTKQVDSPNQRPPTTQGPLETQIDPDETLTKTPKLATPAVRHLSKRLNIDISLIQGTGKDGRVLKEDVQSHASSQDLASPTAPSPVESIPEDRTVSLTPIQTQMYKMMTRSLSIPHFLYTDTVDLTNLTKLRHSLNSQPLPNFPDLPDKPKISALPFIIKALSLSLTQHPLLNTSLTIPSDSPKLPNLTYRSHHNIGIAIDTPHGLLVPVIHHVQRLSILTIARRLAHLTTLARTNKLSPRDLSGATFTMSNIGSIGGGVVSPVLLEGQVAIVGIGQARVVPAFGEDGALVKREECIMSWSADHRVVDGASVARCAKDVRKWLEEPGQMAVVMT